MCVSGKCETEVSRGRRALDVIVDFFKAVTLILAGIAFIAGVFTADYSGATDSPGFFGGFIFLCTTLVSFIELMTGTGSRVSFSSMAKHVLLLAAGYLVLAGLSGIHPKDPDLIRNFAALWGVLAILVLSFAILIAIAVFVSKQNNQETQ